MSKKTSQFTLVLFHFFSSFFPNLFVSKKAILDHRKKVLTIHKRQIDLTPNEYRIVKHLLKESPNPVSVSKLCRATQISKTTVYRSISYLRAKLGPDSVRLANDYGFGYKWI